jgi:hypothetical protein
VITTYREKPEVMSDPATDPTPLIFPASDPPFGSRE